MVFAGVIFALAAAFIQSCCYLISGAYVRRSSLQGWTLTAPQQITMMPFALLLAVFFFPHDADLDWKRLLLWNTLCMLSGYAGNFFLFQMQKQVEPSRTAPLQTLKIPIIVVLSFLFFSKGYSFLQISGVCMIVVSSVLLSSAGTKLDFRTWAALLLCVFSFAVCDIAIAKMLEINSTAFDTRLESVLFTLGIGLLSTGVLALPAIILQKRRSSVPRSSLWVRYALPYSVLWIAALVFLFSSFAVAGVEIGTMVQSSRSLISVVTGYFLSFTCAFDGIETKISRSVFIRRIASAVLMVLSVVLYSR